MDYLNFLIFLIIDLIDSIYIYIYIIYIWLYIYNHYFFVPPFFANHLLGDASFEAFLIQRWHLARKGGPGGPRFGAHSLAEMLRCWECVNFIFENSGYHYDSLFKGCQFHEFRMNFIWILWILWNLLVFGKPKLCHIVSTSSRRSCPCGSKRILWSFSTELDCHDCSCLVTRYEADSQFTWFVCYV